MIVRRTEAGQSWAELAQLDPLASVLDPADRRGLKNYLIDRVHKHALAGAIGEVRGRTVLDFGCGTGRLSDWLVRNGAYVEGVDITPEMITVARRRVPQAQFHTIEGPRLPFPDNHFDLVVTAYVLQYYVEDDAKIASELGRVVHEAGELVAIEQVAERDLGRGGTVAAYREMLRAGDFRLDEATKIRMSDSRILAMSLRLPGLARVPIVPRVVALEARGRDGVPLTSGRYADVLFSATKARA